MRPRSVSYGLSRSGTSLCTFDQLTSQRQGTREKRVTTSSRTEKQVLEDLSQEERALLKRVLEIERAKLHLTAYEATDDLLAAVKEILP